MTRQELEYAVYRDFGYADSPATAISNRIRGYLNDRHRRLTTLPGLEQFRYERTSQTLVASQAAYTLLAPIQKILRIVDTTNDQEIRQRSLDWYRTVDPDPQTGTQEYYIPLGMTPAMRDVGGSGLWVVSGSASDTTQTAKVETIDTNGSVTSTTASLNGTTRVQIGTATNHQRLLDFAISAVGVGAISLYDAAAAGNEVSRIVLGRTNAQNWRIALWPTPAAADTIQIDYLTWIRDFSQAYDEPQLPHDFHYLVAVGAKIDEARKKDDLQRVSGWKQEWDEGIRNLYGFLHLTPDRLIIPGELDETGRSNLGSAFPSGIW